ncbi:MAG: Ger(x)C family spore germination C-terminal domain-containing protein [Christensenellaceae bacterium]|nr:Ger(x)C family spore germination C-terminal domain-containing protein [Christensenellaceae bacterium]
MPRWLKKAASFLLAVALCLPLSACWDSIELNSQIFVINIGLDSGENLAMRMTLELPRISQAGDGGGASNSVEPLNPGDSTLILNGYVLVQAEGNSIVECLNALRAAIPRSVSLLKVMGVYISESFVDEQDLFDALTVLIQPHQIRPMAYVYVCRGRAEDVLRLREPSFGTRLSKSIVAQTEALNDFSVLAYQPLIQFYDHLLDNGRDSYALMVAVNNTQYFSAPGGRDGDQPMDYSPGNLPSNSPIPLDIFGTAIFENDQIVLFLNGYETQLFNLCLGSFIAADLNANDTMRTLQVQLHQLKRPNLRVDISGDRPIIYLDVYLRAGNYVGRLVDEQEVLCARTEAMLEYDITNLLLRMQQTGADPLNIVGRVQKRFWTNQQFDQYGWTEMYGKAGFVVKVHLTPTPEAMVLFS